MRHLTRRGLLTGAAVLALKPLTVPLTPYAEGFTVADLTNAVDVLRAANVPPFEGHYLAYVAPGIRHLFTQQHAAQTLRNHGVILGDGDRDEAPKTEDVLTVAGIREALRFWADPMESALASHEGRQ